MEIIRLEILNLASLDKSDGEVIDFNKGALGDSNIFCIVGPTGSGKSTLLDAICLALYNRAPRYQRKKGEKQNIKVYSDKNDAEKNRIAPTDCRNILTHGKKSGYSKLTFLANNGTLYRAEWHVEFKRKKYDNAKTLLYKISESFDGKQTEEQVDWEELPQIIGLEFEQFLSTVLIAQGSFASFLSADENKRYELLEKLVGCEETYSRIAFEIKAKKESATDDYNRISVSVESSKGNILSDEELAKLTESINLLEKEEKERADKEKAVEKALQWYAENDKKLNNIDSSRKAHEQAVKNLDEIKDKIERLNLYDNLRPAVDIMREIEKAKSEIDNREKEIEKNLSEISRREEGIKAENTTLELLKKNAETAQKLIDEQTPHIIKARELKTNIANAQNMLRERNEALETAKKEELEAKEALKSNEKAKENAAKKLEESKTALQKIEDETNQKRKHIADDVKKKSEALDAEKKKIEGLDIERLNSTKSEIDNKIKSIEKAKEIIVNLQKFTEEESKNSILFQQLENRNKEIDEALNKLNIKSLKDEVEKLQNTVTLIESADWNQHRSNLKQGEACPLCGAKEHPYINKKQLDEAVSYQRNILNEKKTLLNQQIETEKNLSGEREKNNGKISAITPRIKTLKAEIGECNNALKALHESYPKMPLTLDELAKVMPCFEEKQKETEQKITFYNEVQKAINQLNKEKEEATKKQLDFEREANDNIQKATKNVSDYEKMLSEANVQHNALTELSESKAKALSAAEELQKQSLDALQKLETEYKNELGGADPDMLESRLKSAKEQADKAVATKNEDIANQKASLEKINGQLQIRSNKQKEQQQSIKKNSDELDSWINNYNRKSDKPISNVDVAEILKSTDNWELIRQEKDIRNNAKVEAAAVLESLKKNYEEHQRAKPEKEKDALTAELSDLQKSSKNNELIELIAKKNNHDKAVKDLGSKAAELAASEKLMNNWTAINYAIGGDGKTLRKIAQCYTLNFLVKHANAEIRKFNSRYELIHVENSLAIRVIDHDRADDIRDTTSLSGGETFIISLGLALGLSSLSSRNISFNNLFIDEGFGTLDQDTLATVIDSLAMLQSSQGKKVGVISHTDTMSERISTQICIVKNGNSGSSHIEIRP
ncbi:MAG: AAA family ATPase [Bacteroidaceae bacterium]|nr:AAA family ATPase [Bacteroidaceae bacterium]